ncbi:GNAT family N-acetyltransferase [Oceanobacillus massiliensis]|uniref:GNAT family N-acetyltransferase n=1 Tax=Oceanobacillus massiliensis TaxID=1465765 RepID=UPI00301862C6
MDNNRIQITMLDNNEKLDQAIELYQEIWDKAESTERLRKHAIYEGYRGLAAHDENGKLIGFSYGYQSMEGQYYNRLLHEHLVLESLEFWLDDCFEFVELGVHPEARGRGIGERLAAELLEGAKHRHAILTTQEDNHAARSLYEKLGWKEVAAGFLENAPGSSYVIMGKKLK